MAKKRKEKDDEKEIDFKIPKFDEKKFIKTERQKIKITFLSFMFGVAVAFISFGFWSLLSGNAFRWELVLLFGVFTAAWLKYLFIRLNIDLAELGRKGIFSSYAVYFFTWLLILILLVNPPFYDDETPRIEIVTLPSAQELGGTIKIVARITDNVGVDDIDLSLTYPDGTSYHPTDFTFENNIFLYTYENNDDINGTYNFTLLTTDDSGHKSSRDGTFEYGGGIIKLALPPVGSEVTYANSIKFDIESDFDRVYYTVDGGEEINVTEKDGFYETYPKYEGWIKNKNVTVNVYATVIYYFDNLITQFNNTVVDGDSYYFNVSNAPEIGIESPPEIELPHPMFVQVPGFELLVFVLSLIVVLFIFKFRRKEGRRN